MKKKQIVIGVAVVASIALAVAGVLYFFYGGESKVNDKPKAAVVADLTNPEVAAMADFAKGFILANTTFNENLLSVNSKEFFKREKEGTLDTLDGTAQQIAKDLIEAQLTKEFQDKLAIERAKLEEEAFIRNAPGETMVKGEIDGEVLVKSFTSDEGVFQIPLHITSTPVVGFHELVAPNVENFELSDAGPEHLSAIVEVSVVKEGEDYKIANFTPRDKHWSAIRGQ